MSLIESFLVVGCTGVFPLLIIPDNIGSKSTDKTILNALLGKQLSLVWYLLYN